MVVTIIAEEITAETDVVATEAIKNIIDMVISILSA